MAAAPAFAHDFWIEPSSFHPNLAEPIQIALRVGEHFEGEPVKRDPQRFEKFVIAGPEGVKTVVGQDGADPAGLARLDSPGVYVIGYRGRPKLIELEPEKFEAYLKEEGLEHIIAEREKLGERNKPGRESYSRAAKSLLRAGSVAGAGHDRVLDLRIELIPLADPHLTSPGTDELPVVLLFDGKPLSSATLFAMNQADPGNKLTARTDVRGRAVFRLPRAGVWMIKCIHMTRAAESADHDWESLWATLTFEIPAR